MFCSGINGPYHAVKSGQNCSVEFAGGKSVARHVGYAGHNCGLTDQHMQVIACLDEVCMGGIG